MVTVLSLSVLLGVFIQSVLVDSQIVPKAGNPQLPNQQPRGGPNICGSGFRRSCCPGWLTDRNGLCTRAVCRTNCGFGICRSPNLCQCGRNAFGPTCTQIQTGGGRSGCRFNCRNGGRCSQFGCNCRRGFSGGSCERAVCSRGCLNKGRCVAPNRCSCPYGFSGARCELDYRLGECFTKVENMMCKNRLIGVKCTRVACCATVGKAWGVPCRLCPRSLPCRKGYIPNIKAKRCDDADECTMIPNICAAGTCVNTKGSYKCRCGVGRSYDADRHRCVDVDECKKNPNICGNGGKCENLDGSYKCSRCNPGFALNKEKTACVESDTLVVGQCFEAKQVDRCVRPFRISISKKKCCCQNIGKAFGDKCEECPAVATTEYMRLCITGIRPTSPTYVTDKNGARITDKDGNFVTKSPGSTVVTDKDGNVVTDKDGNAVTKPGDNVVTDKDGNAVTDEFGRPITKPATTDDGICYFGRVGGICSRDSVMKIAKSVCCCKIQGLAHGKNCDACPVKGSVAHTRLCITGIDNQIDMEKMQLNECKIQGPEICKNGKCTDLKEGYMCSCNDGYERKDKNTCIDKDECAVFTGMCGKGRCQNTPGSFKCACAKGYRDSVTSTPRCADIDECDQAGTCQNGRCRNLPGSYSCVCNSGFKEDAGGCKDIDECKLQNIMCRGGFCENTPGSYMCTCPKGYGLAADQRTCVDVNECSQSGVCQNGLCINLRGSFRCNCNAGYVATADERSCRDFNECSDKSKCMHGKCINGPGSYRCECDFGYDPAPDGKACLDMRKDSCFAKFDGRMCAMPLMKQLTRSECCCGMEEMGRRGWGQPCQGCPTEGTAAYKKVCPCKGMVSCKKDVDECKNNAGMILGVCKDGRCINTMGDYYCQCNSGFRHGGSRKSCVDIQECTETPEVCMNGACTNTKGGFECKCQKGYVYSRKQGKCIDFNECDQGKNPCKGGECINSAGSFRCKCTVKGHTLDSTGRICQDVRLGKCWTKQVGGVCEKNEVGDVTKAVCCSTGFGVAWGSPCESCPSSGNLGDGCKKGFIKSGNTCKDINECKSFDHMCYNGQCKNTPGSFECVCPTGFTLDDSKRKCLDTRRGVCYESFSKSSCEEPFPSNRTKRECCCSVLGKAWGSPCEICPLKNGPSFNELCRAGNLGDVNECLFGMCKNGRCENTQGSFKCICDRGFDVDSKGRACEDIDECKIAKGICGAGKCVNTPGSFRCVCEAGYRNSEMMEMCMDIDECTESNPMPCNGGICVNTPGSYKCECPAGTEVMGAGIDCEDIDECARIPGICRHGRCQNFIGGYLCACANGFKSSSDMKACLDIDECQINQGGCEYFCNNTVGSYECLCQDGFQLTSNKRTCEDINECTRTPNVCGKGNECKNVIGGHVCICKNGYEPTRDGKACVDIDECKDPNSCKNGKCLNTAGSFLCECGVGYTLMKQAMACIDIDECAVGDKGGCHKNARCVNTVGSFRCECKPGYEGSGKTCQDIDECKLGLSTCAIDAECTNTIGSFSCQCKAGFSGNGISCIDINECFEDKSLCKYGQCTNTFGSYECSCGEVGFRISDDKKSCLDVDECEILKNMVCSHGKCINLIGGFKCVCDVGFQLDNTRNNCTDVNECDKTGMCTNGKCINMMGKYKCACHDGYVPNKEMTACIDNRREPCYRTAPDVLSCANPVADAVMKSSCCCSRFGKAWGKNCELCPPLGSKASKSLCPGGPNTETNGTSITDIDECKKFNNYCKNGKCTNIVGGAKCECPEGFFLNSMENCEDINECNTPYICGYLGKCINEKGSYRCECPTGFTYKVAQKFCVDERKSYCYHSDGDNGGDTANGTLIPGPLSEECTEKFPMNFTRAQCCCNVGTHYGSNICESCPEKYSGAYNALCVGKPSVIKPTSFPTGALRSTVKPGTGTGGPGTGGPGTGIGGPITGTRAPGTGGPDIGGPGTGTGGPGTGGPVTGIGGGVEPTIDPRFDINECKLLRNPCKKGVCTNTNGGYTCKCDMGYESTPSIKMPECVDIDECANNPCINGTCKNFEGGFTCECLKGYDLDRSGRICKDVDECSKDGYCQNGKCKNKLGGFDCKCNSGYILSLDMKTCEDANECSIPGICGAGKCNNLLGSYQCICDEGYRRDTRGRCDDIDECQEQPGLCLNGVCRNTKGGYECECKAGFVTTSSKQSCRDLDECFEVSGFCEYGSCTNTIGSAKCKCNEGFERAGDTCIDIDECTSDPNLCEIGGQCVNTKGSFKCLCNTPGFTLGNQGRSCVDVRKSICFSKLENNRCTRATAFQVTKSTCCCSMKAGWGDPCDLCPKVGTREFSLYCPKGVGYRRNETDINECALQYGNCKNGKCVNTDGSYRCDCNKGYQKAGNSKECVDMNECTEMQAACGKGNCTNSVGSFSCTCQPGYRPGTDSPACVDINECDEEKNLCVHRCSNIPGSYKCLCPRGFKVAADGRMCEDIDECKTAKNNCPQICKNILNGFICLCGEGYKRVGGKCVDIDECAQNAKLCRPNGVCQNYDGGYRCQCTPPYMRSKNGKFCQDMRRGLCFARVIEGVCEAATKKMMKVSEAECCCKGGTAWGPTCSTCPFDGSVAYNTLCSSDGQRLNECDMIAGVCANGKCMDTEDSYMCMCNPGFKLLMNGKKCVDIDECEKNPCEHGCKNLPGSYECKCQKGFVFDKKTKKCADQDECATGAHNCDHNCVNTVGSFKCSCPEGYHKMGASCVDTNECLYNQYICGYGHQCINTPGSYVCRCLMGYIYDKEKKQCVDVDECFGNTQCQHGCENTLGSYRCKCPKGYTRHFFYNQCVDVNECLTGQCSGGRCTNTIGGFQCGCGSGQRYQQGRCGDVNECLQRNPCQYGCTNKEGGFECGCPYGLTPNQGHCIVATGITCTSCDAGKDDADEVPLTKDELATSAPDFGNSGSVALESSESSPSSSSDKGFYQSGYSKSDGYQTGFNPSGYQGGYQGQGGWQQTGFQQGGGQSFSSGFRGYSGYGGVSSNAYNSGSYGTRSARSIRGARRPMVVTIGKELKPTIPLLKFLPAIKGLNFKLEYFISSGNSTLFELSQKGRLGYLHAAHPLHQGSYALKIACKIKKNATIDDEAKLWYSKKKFNLKLVVKVV